MVRLVRIAGAWAGYVLTGPSSPSGHSANHFGFTSRLDAMLMNVCRVAKNFRGRMPVARRAARQWSFGHSL